MLAKLVIVNLVSWISVTNGAKILGIVPTPMHSHQVTFQPIWRELSLRGHQVTTLTTDPINDPLLVNLTEIDLSFSYENMKGTMTSFSEMGVFEGLRNIMTVLVRNLDMQLQHHQVQALLKSEGVEFDLVMVECVTLGAVAFAEKFKCPHIAMLSVDAPNAIYELFGNPSHPILYPDIIAPRSEHLPISNRILSVVYSVAWRTLVNWPVQALEQSLVEKHFGPNYPTVDSMVSNASLLFVNADPIFHQVRPLVPTVIQIGGGLHRTSSKPLPKELQKVLDDASDGFIYFSLGSNVKSNEIPVETRNVILAAFSELPYTVLWKFESDELLNKPSNVYISKWLPQQDIFKHPNIKLFITQGGLQSMDEAIYDHIPMVGMPFFGDQPYNVKKMVAKGFGLSVEYHTLQKDDFKDTILEVINNPKYRNNVIELATLARDQPMTGLERAVWWTEYVLRHKGAKHLRSPALDIPLYQYFLLDVIAVLLSAFVVLIALIYVLIKSLTKFITVCCSKFKSKVKKH